MKVLIGDIFSSKAKTLVNTVNCVGVMGKGIALEFKKKYPNMYKDYLQKCKNKQLKPGKPYVYQDLLGTSVMNFPTKDDWRSPSNISYVIDGLKWFIDNYQSLGITSIAFPPLGCGNGGLLWDDVGPIMYKALAPLPIDIEVYAPYGTKQEKLSKEFLSDYKGISKRIGERKENLNKNWLCVLEIVYRLNKNIYVRYVGRTIFQKICYISTLEGIDTNFKFSQGSYGPYSNSVKEAYTIMANTMLIEEHKKDKMNAIFTTSNYEKMRNANIDIINKNEKIIEKITDLFMRIRDTAQAELYSTIIFSYKEMTKNQQTPNEHQLFEHIATWKKHWNNDEKHKEIDQGIIDLNLLGYIKVDFSSI